MIDEQEMEQTLPTWQQDMEYARIAAGLLWAIWNGIDRDYLSQYRATIWEQFENETTNRAHMTGSLNKFVSLLCGRFNVQCYGKDTQQRAYALAVLDGRYGHPNDAILRVLRDYSVTCVALLRDEKDREKQEKGLKS